MNESVISAANKLMDGLRSCQNPKRCRAERKRSFNEIMASEWEELVITFDKQKNDYVFKTASVRPRRLAKNVDPNDFVSA